MKPEFSQILHSIDRIGIEKHRVSLFENADTYLKSDFRFDNISGLRDVLSTKPTVIVSAGPSLGVH